VFDSNSIVVGLLNFLFRYVARTRAEMRKKSEHTVTDHQVHEQRHKDQALKREYQDWVIVRQSYIPIANALDEAEAAKRPLSKSLQPWEVKLWLPSGIPVESRNVGCTAGLPALEKRARVGQAILALAHVRMGLRMRYNAQRGTRMHAYGTGEKTMTRARARLRTIETKLDRDVRQYRIAYDALLSLDPNKDGYELLRPLSDADVRGPDRDADEVDLERRGQSKSGLPSVGNYESSWIWTVYGATRFSTDGTSAQQEAAENKLFKDQIRTTWAKARARHQRWVEEVLLLCEEIRRTLEFMTWKAKWWRNRATVRGTDVDTPLGSGLASYAHEQAEMYETIGRQFALKWAPLFLGQELHIPWLTQWLPTDYRAPPLPRSRAKVPLDYTVFKVPRDSHFHPSPDRPTTTVPILQVIETQSNTDAEKNEDDVDVPSDIEDNPFNWEDVDDDVDHDEATDLIAEDYELLD
jgi:hypothetical protein